jgi:hypothetical protein
MRRIASFLLCLLAGGALPLAGQDSVTNRDPARVRFVTSDIENFWRAYDLAAVEPDRARRVEIFQREYLERGSAGLQDFVRLRIKSAEELVRALERTPRYYASIREATRRVGALDSVMRASFQRFREFYPDAVFPDVYFVIGISNTGGTVSSNGLLIGAEMYGMGPATPLDELPAWLASVLKSVESLPAIVAHESCHFNQSYPEPRTLLGKSIQEGSCDFIGELISGATVNPEQAVWAEPRQAELWREFEPEMAGSDYRNWLYNGAGAGDRPGDLGYYIGYRIVRAYYEAAPDRSQALREILQITDFPAFLEASRYRETLGR